MKPPVLFVTPELDVGGSELQLLTLLPRLKDRYAIHVGCEMGQGSVAARLQAQGIRVHFLHVPSRFDPRAPWWLLKLVRHLRPRALVGALIHAEVVSRLAGRAAGVPLIISNQRSSYVERPYLKWLDRITKGLVHHHVVQTAHAASQLARLGIPPARITVIPNAVEAPRAVNPHRVRNELGLGAQTTIITCVASLKAGKGHDLLLTAAARLRRRRLRPWQLLFVGDGPLRTSLHQRATALGLNQIVRWLGQRDDMPDILGASDAFVLPSLGEGMSNALLEAMAAQLPCLVADIPANRSVITPQVTGLIFAAGQSASLASALMSLIAAPAFRHLGVQAAQLVRRYHDPQVIADQWAALFRRLLSPTGL